MLGIAAEDDDDAQASQPKSQFKAPKPKRARDATGEAEDVTDYLTDAQRKKIYALRGKLIKAEVFTEETFDEAARRRIRRHRHRPHPQQSQPPDRPPRESRT